MNKCPNCNHKLYTYQGNSKCKFCGYTNTKTLKSPSFSCHGLPEIK